MKASTHVRHLLLLLTRNACSLTARPFMQCTTRSKSCNNNGREIKYDAPYVVELPIELNTTAIHERFMSIALEQARHAQERYDEVPIGATVVIEGAVQHHTNKKTMQPQQPSRIFTVLSTGCNMVETTHDASAHAELIALRQAAANLQNWRLINATLYSTLEPCPMCVAAAQAFRIQRIVYGAPDIRLGAVKTHLQLLDIVKHPYHDTIDVVDDVLGRNCSALMTNFFRSKRKQQKKDRKRCLEMAKPCQHTKKKDNVYQRVGMIAAMWRWAKKVFYRTEGLKLH